MATILQYKKDGNYVYGNDTDLTGAELEAYKQDWANKAQKNLGTTDIRWVESTAPTTKYFKKGTSVIEKGWSPATSSGQFASPDDYWNVYGGKQAGMGYSEITPEEYKAYNKALADLNMSGMGTPDSATQQKIDQYVQNILNTTPTAQNPLSGQKVSALTGTAPVQIAQSETKVLGDKDGQSQYVYGADVLDKKANNAAVNTLYQSYFGRNATAAELANWGATGGADTTVKALEDFLRQERAKYGVTTPITPIQQVKDNYLAGSANTSKPSGNIEMTADTLGKSEEPLGAVGATPGTDITGDVLVGAESSAKQIQDRLNATQTEEGAKIEKQTNDFEDKLSGILGELENRPADQLSFEEQYKVPQLKQDYTDIKNAIEMELASYKLKYESIENKPITMSSIIGQQANEQKIHLAKLGWLQAQASGALGDLQNAQDQADRAVDAKYSVLDTRAKVYQAQLDLLEGKKDREEEKVAIQKQLMLDEYIANLNEKKDEEKSVKALALQAQANGADSKLVDMIANSKTLLEATQVAGQLATTDGWAYVSTPAERDKLKAQGYEITQSGGRTYARKPQGLTTKNIQVGSGNSAREYLITYDENGNEIKRELLSGGGGNTSTVKPEDAMMAQLSTVVGSDGFVSPDNYTIARNAWIAEGLSPTTFDTKMKGFRNPNNPNYVITKTSSSSGGGQTP